MVEQYASESSFFFLPLPVLMRATELREVKGLDFLPSLFRMQAVISLNLSAVARPEVRRVDVTISYDLSSTLKRMKQYWMSETPMFMLESLTQASSSFANCGVSGELSSSLACVSLIQRLKTAVLPTPTSILSWFTSKDPYSLVMTTVVGCNCWSSAKHNCRRCCHAGRLGPAGLATKKLRSI